jgi:hypothetical protein
LGKVKLLKLEPTIKRKYLLQNLKLTLLELSLNIFSYCVYVVLHMFIFLLTKKYRQHILRREYLAPMANIFVDQSKQSLWVLLELNPTSTQSACVPEYASELRTGSSPSRNPSVCLAVYICLYTVLPKPPPSSPFYPTLYHVSKVTVSSSCIVTEYTRD